jgi:hypothetical protein
LLAPRSSFVFFVGGRWKTRPLIRGPSEEGGEPGEEERGDVGGWRFVVGREFLDVEGEVADSGGIGNKVGRVGEITRGGGRVEEKRAERSRGRG